MEVCAQEVGEGVAVMVANFAQLNIEEGWSPLERKSMFCKWLGHVHLMNEPPGISKDI